MKKANVPSKLVIPLAYLAAYAIILTIFCWLMKKYGWPEQLLFLWTIPIPLLASRYQRWVYLVALLIFVILALWAIPQVTTSIVYSYQTMAIIMITIGVMSEIVYNLVRSQVMNEQALRAKDDLYSELFESLGDGIAIVDQNETVTFANPATDNIFGVPTGELVGHNLEEYTNPSQFAAVKLQTQKRRRGESGNYRIEIMRQDGAKRSLLVAATPRYDSNRQFIGSYCILGDMTQHIQGESSTERNAREMAALYLTSLQINTKLELSKLLNLIVRRAASLLGAQMGGLYLIKEDGKNLTLEVSYNLPGDYVGTTLKLGEGVAGRVVETAEPLNIADYKEWSGRAQVYDDSSFRRVLGVPLKIGNRVLGAISITDDEKTGQFTEEEVRLVLLFANQAAVAIENARNFDEARQRTQYMELVDEISFVSTQSPEMDIVLQTVVDRLVKSLIIDQVRLALFNDNQNQLIVQAAHAAQGNSPGIGTEISIDRDPLIQQCIETKKQVYVPDAQSDLSVQASLNPKTQDKVVSILLMPLNARDRIIGVLICESVLTPRQFSADELHLLETITNLTAVRIEQGRLEREVHFQTIIDELTGVYNRKGLYEFGRLEVNRARHFNRPLAALFIDIDRFRNYNEIYSYAVGNRVLRAVTQCCLAWKRDVDILARIGGEEFVILLPEADLEIAAQEAERLRKEIEKTTVATAWGDLAVSVSVGVASLTPDIQDARALIKRASQSMKTAKKEGHNRVVVHAPIID